MEIQRTENQVKIILSKRFLGETKPYKGRTMYKKLELLLGHKHATFYPNISYEEGCPAEFTVFDRLTHPSYEIEETQDEFIIRVDLTLIPLQYCHKRRLWVADHIEGIPPLEEFEITTNASGPRSWFTQYGNGACSSYTHPEGAVVFSLQPSGSDYSRDARGGSLEGGDWVSAWSKYNLCLLGGKLSTDKSARKIIDMFQNISLR